MAPTAAIGVLEADARLARLRGLLEAAGHAFVEPAVLQPVEPFVDLAGEDLRRRLFLTSAADGRELCLRPDYTIPVCRLHLDTGSAGRQARYAYLGPVFRQRPQGPSEFLQAGAEWLGHADEEATDAEALARALEAAAVLGLDRPTVRIGDEALFAAVVGALDLSDAWRRRLTSLFGDGPRLTAALDRLDGTAAPERAAVAGALAFAEPETARALVEDMLSIAGLSTVGGRGAGEIAERLAEQAAFAAGARPAPEAAAVIRRYLAIAAPADAAGDAVAAFARDAGSGVSAALAAALDAFRRRLDLLAERGVAAAGLGFEAAFGRPLDYYTGFMFELYDPARPDGAQVVGGGRYDRMLTLLGAEAPVPAVGFSVWLDRLGFGGRA
ncbi:ATP phosphoribosyltransferase regulatory subunit [Pseudoxanthobacter sp. M-2]|uniref:ATP phosphoribosyltransferase regulatory subunit n=1 Tax=Pseudoxanthobacter sp. M-2 TaxID=3078754 RepID=UPI0038FC4AD0